MKTIVALLALVASAAAAENFNSPSQPAQPPVVPSVELADGTTMRNVRVVVLVLPERVLYVVHAGGVCNMSADYFPSRVLALAPVYTRDPKVIAVMPNPPQPIEIGDARSVERR